MLSRSLAARYNLPRGGFRGGPLDPYILLARTARANPPFIDTGAAFMFIASASEFPANNLLDRARGGDQQAWQLLFDDCYPKVLRVVTRRLSGRMRKLCDSTDIANDVMKSLAAKFNNFDFTSIDGLRAFLIHAAEQKLIDGQRRAYAQKRNVARDRPLAGDDGVAWELLDHSPTASQLAIESEQVEMLLNAQTDQGREILKLKIQGMSNSDVCRQTGWNLRKLQRFLESLRGTLRLG